MALPVLAGTAQGQPSGWSQMQNFMQQAFNNQSSVPSSSNGTIQNPGIGNSPYGYGMMGGYGGSNGTGGYGMMGGYGGSNSNAGYGMMGSYGGPNSNFGYGMMGAW